MCHPRGPGGGVRQQHPAAQTEQLPLSRLWATRSGCSAAWLCSTSTPLGQLLIHAALDYCLPQEAPVFRVVDPRTEEISLSPVRAGVVVFNLLAKRIVQLQNTYSEIRRKGRVRVLRNNQPTDRVHRYELPEDWSLVPSRATP